jgi:hypothetical protein
MFISDFEDFRRENREKGFPLALTLLGLLGVGVFAFSKYAQSTTRVQQPRRRRARKQRPPIVRREGELIDLNHCDIRQLASLQGVDSELAERIFENRPYMTKIDLVSRLIVPEEVYVLFKEDVTARYAA